MAHIDNFVKLEEAYIRINDITFISTFRVGEPSRYIYQIKIGIQNTQSDIFIMDYRIKKERDIAYQKLIEELSNQSNTK